MKEGESTPLQQTLIAIDWWVWRAMIAACVAVFIVGGFSIRDKLHRHAGQEGAVSLSHPITDCQMASATK